MTIVAIINKNTNIVENVSLDDRPIDQINLPDPYFVLDLSTLLSVKWNKVNDEWVQTTPVLGEGGKGDVWDGEKLVRPKSADD